MTREITAVGAEDLDGSDPVEAVTEIEAEGADDLAD